MKNNNKEIKNLRINAGAKLLTGALAGLGVMAVVLSTPKATKGFIKKDATLPTTADKNIPDNSIEEKTPAEVIVDNTYANVMSENENTSENIEETEEVNETVEVEEKSYSDEVQEKYETEIVEFTKYATSWGLDYEQIESLLFAMNGANNIMYGDIVNEDEKIISENLVRNIDTAINIISEKQFNGEEKFDLSKAIITSEKSEVERAVLAELQNQVSEFNANPTLDNLTKAYHNLSFSSDYPVEYKDNEETKVGKLNRNQRDVALKLNALEMYFTIAMDSKLSRNEEVKAEILNAANIPYSFAYTDEQLNCEKVYSYMH